MWCRSQCLNHSRRRNSGHICVAGALAPCARTASYWWEADHRHTLLPQRGYRAYGRWDRAACRSDGPDNATAQTLKCAGAGPIGRT